jgi:hypothetical protein
MTGPNLMADSSFESMETRVFSIYAPFRVTTDPPAHSGKAGVPATLSRSGKRIYSHVSIWTNTEYVSSLWLRGNGGGTFFVATGDLSRRLAAVQLTATAQWRKVSLPWHSGAQTSVAVGFATTPSGTPTGSFGCRQARRTAGTATGRSISTASHSRPSAGPATRYPRPVAPAAPGVTAATNWSCSWRLWCPPGSFGV